MNEDTIKVFRETVVNEKTRIHLIHTSSINSTISHCGQKYKNEEIIKSKVSSTDDIRCTRGIIGCTECLNK